MASQIVMVAGHLYSGSLIPEDAVIEMNSTKFAEGRFRDAYRATWVKPDYKACKPCVIKRKKSGMIYQQRRLNDFNTTLKLVKKAQELADGFNESLTLTKTPMSITFESVAGITVASSSYGPTLGECVTVEKYLEGEYQKWCTNYGYNFPAALSTDIVMPAFMHWSWVHTKGEFMISDLQGVRNDDSYSLTDPAIMSLNEIYGETDTGVEGMLMFFKNHQCNDICKGLLKPNASDLNHPLIQMAQQQPNPHTTYKWQLNPEQNGPKSIMKEVFRGYFVTRGQFPRPRLRHNELPDGYIVGPSCNPPP